MCIELRFEAIGKVLVKVMKKKFDQGYYKTMRINMLL